MSLTRYGLDISVMPCHLYWVDRDSGQVVNQHLVREALLIHFADRAPCVIGLETGAGAQGLARQLKQSGHDIKLIPRKVIQSFAGGNKNQAVDARAIWLALQHAGVKTVPVQTEEQEAVQAIEEVRKQLLKCRALHSTGLRSLLDKQVDRAGLSPAMPSAPAALDRSELPAAAAPDAHWSALLLDTMREQTVMLSMLDQHIAHIEQRLKR
jgi:transposase